MRSHLLLQVQLPSDSPAFTHRSLERKKKFQVSISRGESVDSREQSEEREFIPKGVSSQMSMSSLVSHLNHRINRQESEVSQKTNPGSTASLPRLKTQLSKDAPLSRLVLDAKSAERRGFGLSYDKLDVKHWMKTND